MSRKNLKDFPVTIEYVSDLLLFVENIDDQLHRVRLFLEYINNRSKALSVTTSCSLHTLPTAYEKAQGLLSFDAEKYEYGPLGEITSTKDFYMIDLTNARSEDLLEQLFTICHELGHLFFAYEHRLENLDTEDKPIYLLNFGYPQNIEELCDLVAEILLLKKPLN